MFSFFKRRTPDDGSKPVSASEAQRKPYAVAFVDYEHWYISYDRMYRSKPDIRAWREALAERYDVGEIFFFGDFSNPSLRSEIPKIREITSFIIETQNASSHFEKDFTDFIMLDHIYQKAVTDENIDAFIIFSGDGHFSSVVSFIRNRVGKEVGVYAVKGALSSQLRNSASYAEEVMPDIRALNALSDAGSAAPSSVRKHKSEKAEVKKNAAPQVKPAEAKPSETAKAQKEAKHEKSSASEKASPSEKSRKNSDNGDTAKTDKEAQKRDKAQNEKESDKKKAQKPKKDESKPTEKNPAENQPNVPKPEAPKESKADDAAASQSSKRRRRPRRSKNGGEGAADTDARAEGEAAASEVKPSSSENAPENKPQKQERTEISVNDGCVLILKNLDYLEKQNDGKSYPTFWGTVEVVSRINRADKRVIIDSMHYLLAKEYVYQDTVELDGKSVKVLKADWDRAYGLYRRNSQN